MKVEHVAARFERAGELFACPKCGGPARLTDKSYVCPQGHCYDLSKKNYVNFSPDTGNSKYTAELFAARSAVMADGFYTPIAEAIAQHTALSGQNPVILDAGCGEGYYAAELQKNFPDARILAVDLAKEAVITAARRHPELYALVADLAKLPLQDATVDTIVNVLTPANYREFFRVLKPGGRLIKVIPGADYLAEIRNALGDRLSRDHFSNAKVLAHIADQTEILTHQTLCYTKPVNARQRANFIAMTPMTFNLENKAAFKPEFDTITIHMEILVCQVPKR